jgi:alpha-methylacyl-CoA racemase
MLEGITVLDLSTVGPAARAGRWLADYGATVVKVGPVPADAGVQITPPFHSYSAGRGLQRILIDMKAPDGREAFLRLAEHADVVIESFRPGVVDRLGIGYEAVSARNPRVVYCSTSGYGQDGPHSQWAGHDLNYLAISGFLDCTGRNDDGKPPVPGATVADSAGGGMHAVIAILAALVRRANSDVGAYLDVAAADGILGIMALMVDEFLATGEPQGPGTGLLLGRYACYDTYETRDGGWLSVAAIEPKFWSNLCTLLGLEQWVQRQYDDDVREEIRADVARVLLTRDRDDWARELAPADTCVAPVLAVAEVVNDEQYLARGAFVDAVHPEHGTFRQIGHAFAGTVRPAEPVVARDATTTETDQLLAAAGFSADDITKLRDAGVVA